MVRIKYVGDDEEEFYVKRYLKRYYYTWMKCKIDGLLNLECNLNEITFFLFFSFFFSLISILISRSVLGNRGRVEK